MTEKQLPRSLTYRILRATADQSEIDIEALPPLYDTINPDALDALFAPRFDGTPRGDGQTTFDYAGYVVTVYSDGDVEIGEGDL